MSDNEKLTPAEWADRKGIAAKPDPTRPWLDPVAKSTEACPLGIHLHAADTLHGWSWEASQYQAPADAFRISEQDFDAALKAGAAYPAEPAHLPAVATHHPKRKELAAEAEEHTKRTAKADAAVKAAGTSKRAEPAKEQA